MSVIVTVGIILSASHGSGWESKAWEIRNSHTGAPHDLKPITLVRRDPWQADRVASPPWGSGEKEIHKVCELVIAFGACKDLTCCYGDTSGMNAL